MKPYYEQDGVTIYHGDCRDVFSTLLHGVNLVLTDPPFGKSVRDHHDGTHGWAVKWDVVGDGDQWIGQWALDLCWVRNTPTIAFASPMLPWSGSWRQHLVWDKGPAVGGGGDTATCWKQTWEMIQVARTPKLNAGRDSAVLRFWITQADYALHPTQKPLDLLGYLIAKATQPGELIVDPFAGSGSTLVAAKNLGRRAIGIEVEERYCDIAAKRLEQGVLDFGGAA